MVRREEISIKANFGAASIAAGILIAIIIMLPVLAQSGHAADASKYEEGVMIRGQVATGDFTWDPQNFAGLYYDLDANVGTESLSATVRGGKLSGDYPYGLFYDTFAQKKPFRFHDWGSYYVIGFLGKKCFAGYLEGTDSERSFLFKKSMDPSSLAKGQLEEVLLDSDAEMSISNSQPLELMEGYELKLTAVDALGERVFVELLKNSQVIDSKQMNLGNNAARTDKTYYYKETVGNQKNLVIIAVHLKNAFTGADEAIGTVDGIWQISSQPLSVQEKAKFDKMTVQAVDLAQMRITLANQDYPITLSKHKDTLLMGDICLKTADSDSLRYYIYKAI
jgi:S-layer protein (TIGR01567 family)